MGEELYYAASSQTFTDGDKVEYGAKGVVVGPATSESHKGKGLAMQFPGNKGPTRCYLTQLSRTKPVCRRTCQCIATRAAPSASELREATRTAAAPRHVTHAQPSRHAAEPLASTLRHATLVGLANGLPRDRLPILNTPDASLLPRLALSGPCHPTLLPSAPPFALTSAARRRHCADTAHVHFGSFGRLRRSLVAGSSRDILYDLGSDLRRYTYGVEMVLLCSIWLY